MTGSAHWACPCSPHGHQVRLLVPSLDSPLWTVAKPPWRVSTMERGTTIMSTDSTTETAAYRAPSVVREPGRAQVTVTFTLATGQPVPSQWDADIAAREVVRAYRHEYGLESATVDRIGRGEGRVILTEQAYADLVASKTSNEPAGA